MMRVRLLPVLLFGLVSLFGLKMVGLLTDSSSVTSQSAFITAPSLGERLARGAMIARQGVQEEQIITGSVPKKPAEEKKEPAKGKDEADTVKPKIVPEPEGTRVVIPQQPTPITSAEERNLLEKLKERRDSLEARNKDIEMRDSLLRATEQKLDERVGVLKSLEGASENAGGKDDVKARYKPLIIMYESMKPKDAARVFDKLDVKELLEIVRHMNPRKMSEVLAVMEPAAAVKLTVAMAREANTVQGKVQQSEMTTQSLTSEVELPRLNSTQRMPPPASTQQNRLQ